MADHSAAPADSVFNHMVETTTYTLGDTNIASLNNSQESLNNWTDVNTTLTKGQVEDTLVPADPNDSTQETVDGTTYKCHTLDSQAYDMWMDEGCPMSGQLFDTVNEQSFLVYGEAINRDTYVPLTSTYNSNNSPEETGYVEVSTPETFGWFLQNQFINVGNMHTSCCDYLFAVSTTFMTMAQGLAGQYDTDSDNYSTDMDMLNNISSTQSSTASEEEQASSNSVNTQGSVISQITSAANSVVQIAQLVCGDTWGALISVMNKF